MSSQDTPNPNQSLVPQDADASMVPQPAVPSWQHDRLRDLQRNITRDQQLLAAYEDQLAVEEDPRRLLKIKHNIDRQKLSIQNYQQQYDEATSGGTLAVPDTAAQLASTISALRAQVAGMEQRLAAQMDAQTTTLSSQLTQLSAEQQAVVDQLLVLVDQNQLSLDLSKQLESHLQRALVDLKHAASKADIVRIEQALSEQTSVAGKLKLMLPLVPGLLAYEQEFSYEWMPDLRAVWQDLRSRIRR